MNFLQVKSEVCQRHGLVLQEQGVNINIFCFHPKNDSHHLLNLFTSIDIMFAYLLHQSKKTIHIVSLCTGNDLHTCVYNLQKKPMAVTKKHMKIWY